MTRAFGGRRAALLLAAALAAGASAAPAQESRSGLAGSYLAGRAADAASDVDAAATYYLRALRADRSDLALMERAVVNLVAAGRVAQAVDVARDLAEAEPDHRVANLVLLVDDVDRGDYSAARALTEERSDGFHPLIRGLFDAWAAFGLDDREAAAAALEALDEGQLLRVFGRYHAGLMRAAEGDPAASVEAFAAAAEDMNAPSSRLARAWGAELERLGRVDEARALYEQVMGSVFGDPAAAAALARLAAGEPPPPPLVASATEGAAEALIGLAGVLTGDAGRRFALAYARLAAHLRPDFADAQLLIAELLTADGQDRLALAAYDAVPSTSPFRLRAQIGRAEALRALERDEAAAEALRTLVSLQPDAVEVHVALADQLRRMERWDEAAEAYGDAIEAFAEAGRENWSLYYQRGIANERGDDWSAAEDDFEKALELEPDQPLVLNYLGYTWVDRGEHLDEAKAMIERAVELRPDDGYITDSLGWALYKLGDFPGAVEHLERAVELVPDDPVINDHLGDAYWRVGRRLEAEFQWRRARSFDPEPAALAMIKRKLDVGLDRAEAEAQASPLGEGTPAANGG